MPTDDELAHSSSEERTVGWITLGWLLSARSSYASCRWRRGDSRLSHAKGDERQGGGDGAVKPHFYGCIERKPSMEKACFHFALGRLISLRGVPTCHCRRLPATGGRTPVPLIKRPPSPPPRLMPFPALLARGGFCGQNRTSLGKPSSPPLPASELLGCPRTRYSTFILSQ